MSVTATLQACPKKPRTPSNATSKITPASSPPLRPKTVRQKQNAARREALLASQGITKPKKPRRSTAKYKSDGRTTSPIRSRKLNGWGRPWTPKELDKVRAWQEQGVPQEEQARQLNRPLASVQSAVARYKLGKHPHTNYDPDKRALIMSIIERGGYRQTDIVKEVGDKSHTHVSIIVRELEARGLVKRKTRCSHP